MPIDPALDPIFDSAGQAYNVNPDLLKAVALQESGGSTARDVVSSTGAQGIMQLMPGTAKALGVTDPFDPAQAIPAAASLLARGLDKGEALAANNPAISPVNYALMTYIGGDDTAKWGSQTQAYPGGVAAKYASLTRGAPAPAAAPAASGGALMAPLTMEEGGGMPPGSPAASAGAVNGGAAPAAGSTQPGAPASAGGAAPGAPLPRLNYAMPPGVTIDPHWDATALMDRANRAANAGLDDIALNAREQAHAIMQGGLVRGTDGRFYPIPGLPEARQTEAQAETSGDVWTKAGTTLVEVPVLQPDGTTRRQTMPLAQALNRFNIAPAAPSAGPGAPGAGPGVAAGGGPVPLTPGLPQPGQAAPGEKPAAGPGIGSIGAPALTLSGPGGGFGLGDYVQPLGGEDARKEIDALNQHAAAAQEDLGTLQNMRDLIDGGRLQTGWGAEMKAKVAKILAAAHVDPGTIQTLTGENPSDADAFNKLQLKLYTAAVRGMGAREPGSVIGLFAGNYPNLETQPQALDLMTNELQMGAQRAVDRRDAALAGWRAGGQNYAPLTQAEADFDRTNSAVSYMHAGEALTNGYQQRAFVGLTPEDQQGVLRVIPKGRRMAPIDGRQVRAQQGQFIPNALYLGQNGQIARRTPEGGWQPVQ